MSTPVSDKVRRVAGFDISGCMIALRPKQFAILSTHGGDASSKLRDGSPEDQIKTPFLRRSSELAASLIAMDESGGWLSLQPSPAERLLGKLQLVNSAGGIGWESISANKTYFNREDIDNADTCSVSVAGLRECAGSLESRLVRIGLSDLLGRMLNCDTLAASEAPIASLFSCSASGISSITPEDGMMLVGRKVNDIVQWVKEPVPTVSSSTSAVKLVLKYNGSDQRISVPSGKTRMRIKAWGAGGASDYPGASYVASGGVGGFVQYDLVVTPGDQYTAVIGQGGNDLVSVYGFGGSGQGVAHNHNGGGGTFLLTGTAAATAADASRLVSAAAGGGAGGHSGGGGSAVQGGNGGGDVHVGGMPTFQGASAFGSQYSGGGGGGGGYAGGSNYGLGGNGGTNYVSSSASAVTNQGTAYPGLTVPGSTNSDYQDSAGAPGTNGLMVVEFFDS